MSNKYDLYVRVEVRQPEMAGSGLSVEERAQIFCETFLEVAAVLAEFHKLTEAIKQRHAVKK